MAGDYAAIDLERESWSEMLSWLRRRRQARQLAEADAEALSATTAAGRMGG